MIATTLVAPPAIADVFPNNMEGCQKKKEQDACTTDDGKAGVCKLTEWNTPQYGPNGPNGSVQHKALTCEPPQPPSTRPPPFSMPEEPSSLSDPWVVAVGAASVLSIGSSIVLYRRTKRKKDTTRVT